MPSCLVMLNTLSPPCRHFLVTLPTCQLLLILLRIGLNAVSLATSVTNLHVGRAGHLAVSALSSPVHASPRAKTSSIVLRTPLSAPMQAMVVMVATVPGTTSSRQVL